MILSKLILNNNCPQVKRDIGNPYNMHRTIMHAFPVPLPAEERVLFRIENRAPKDDPLVLVQSIGNPDWRGVVKKYAGYFLREPQVRSLEKLRIKKGDKFRFRMRVVVSKRVSYKNTGKSQRISLFSEKDHLEWLLRKSKNGGFSLLKNRLVIRDAPYRSFNINTPEKNHHVTLNMVDVDGILVVEETHEFLGTLKKGLGPAKGFGAGLLSLAKS